MKRKERKMERNTINEWVKKKETKRALLPSFFLSYSFISFLLSILFSSSGKVFKERRRLYQIQLVSEWKEVRRLKEMRVRVTCLSLFLSSKVSLLTFMRGKASGTPSSLRWGRKEQMMIILVIIILFYVSSIFPPLSLSSPFTFFSLSPSFFFLLSPLSLSLSLPIILHFHRIKIFFHTFVEWSQAGWMKSDEQKEWKRSERDETFIMKVEEKRREWQEVKGENERKKKRMKRRRSLLCEAFTFYFLLIIFPLVKLFMTEMMIPLPINSFFFSLFFSFLFLSLLASKRKWRERENKERESKSHSVGKYCLFTNKKERKRLITRKDEQREWVFCDVMSKESVHLIRDEKDRRRD